MYTPDIRSSFTIDIQTILHNDAVSCSPTVGPEGSDRTTGTDVLLTRSDCFKYFNRELINNKY